MVNFGLSVFAGTSSWKEQFTEALTVSGGDDDEAGEDSVGGDGRSSSPSTADYLMHFLTIFWKILFAFVPPTGKYRPSVLIPIENLIYFNLSIFIHYEFFSVVSSVKIIF